MNRVWVALLGLTLLSACKDKRVGEPIVPQAATPELPASGWVLTTAMIDGYVRYQRTLLVQAGKLPPPVWDGGLKKFEEPTVEQKADLDERARLEAGLTADDVLQIEAMLGEVASRRMTHKLMHLDDAPPEVAMPAEVETGPQEHLEQRKKMKKDSEDLPVERAAFGSRNVDVLLQREDELLKNWALMMDVPELANGRRR